MLSAFYHATLQTQLAYVTQGWSTLCLLSQGDKDEESEKYVPHSPGISLRNAGERVHVQNRGYASWVFLFVNAVYVCFCLEANGAREAEKPTGVF